MTHPNFCTGETLENKWPENIDLVGVISDTHGYLDSQVFDFFDGVDIILHAGDVGSEEVAVELEAIAPMAIVAGNVDGGLSGGSFPMSVVIQLGNVQALLIHEGVASGMPLPLVGPLVSSHQANVVVCGHTHQPFARWLSVGNNGRCFFLNPGSAGKKRFNLPRTVVRMEVKGRGEISGMFLSLDEEKKDEKSFLIKL
jgi:putative phosphoesterase